MMFLQLDIPTVDQLIQYLLILLGLALAWILLRFLLKLTAKLFVCGCAMIVVVSVVAVVLRYLGLI
jgi:hypothetical protein